MIDAAGVRKSLTIAQCIDAMETAMRAVSEQSVAIPPRTIMPLVDSSGFFGVMPGSMADPLVYGAKIVSVHPANAGTDRPTIQGFVVLFDHRTGEPAVMVDGAEITAIRTAAASALSTRLLAREDASSLGIFGTGVQAARHLEAVCKVRPIADVRIWARTFERAQAFVAEHQGRSGARLAAVEDPREAAACDIVCTVTASPEPVLQGAWVSPGSHVNLVGAYSAQTREADTDLVRRARIYVDSAESAFSEAGDILIPIEEGAITPDHVVGEIGKVLLGLVPARAGASDITMYKSLGLVAQDLVAAHVAHINWQARTR